MLIDWFTVGAQAINFLILVWLLKRFLYKPVLAAIDAREKRIAAQLQDAEKKKEEAEKEQTEFGHRNEEFESKRSALLLDATNAAKTEREKLLGVARQDSDALRAKLRKAAEGEIEGLSKKIGTLAQAGVFSIARKTLADLAGVGLEERMTELLIRRFQGLTGTEREGLKASLQTSSNSAVVRSAFDLAPAQKSAIEGAVRPFLRAGAGVVFETKPDLISGIELVAGGQKIAWDISGYLDSLSKSVGSLIKPEISAVPVPPEVLAHAA